MTWTYTNQDRSKWPDWISGANFAQSPTGDKILIHRLEVCHLIFEGDIIERKPTGELVVTPPA